MIHLVAREWKRTAVRLEDKYYSTYHIHMGQEQLFRWRISITYRMGHSYSLKDTRAQNQNETFHFHVQHTEHTYRMAFVLCMLAFILKE
jgi:hypothetical protein